MVGHSSLGAFKLNNRPVVAELVRRFMADQEIEQTTDASQVKLWHRMTAPLVILRGLLAKLKVHSVSAKGISSVS